MIRTKQRKEITLGRPLGVEPAKATNHRWSLGFVVARLENRRSFRILTVVDQFARECVAIRGKPGLTGGDLPRLWI